MNLCAFYFYKFIGKLTTSLKFQEFTFLHMTVTTEFHYKRVPFSSQLKSKVVNTRPSIPPPFHWCEEKYPETSSQESRIFFYVDGKFSVRDTTPRCVVSVQSIKTDTIFQITSSPRSGNAQTVLETKTVNVRTVTRVKVEQQMKMVLISFTPGVFSGLTRNHRYRKILESEL